VITAYGQKMDESRLKTERKWVWNGMKVSLKQGRNWAETVCKYYE